MFSLLKRFIAWIVRGVAIIVFVLALIAVFAMPEYRTAAIIVAVVCFLIAGASVKFSEKAEKDSVGKCKKCKGSMRGASYKYRYNISKASKHPISGLYNLGVDYDVTCPHCGKVKWVIQTLELCESELYSEAVNAEAEKRMDGLLS